MPHDYVFSSTKTIGNKYCTHKEKYVSRFRPTGICRRELVILMVTHRTKLLLTLSIVGAMMGGQPWLA